MKLKMLLAGCALALALPFANAGAFNYSCTDCPITISSTGTPTVLSVINVGDTGTITDLNVFINIQHTFPADLDIFLIHNDTGTIVELSTDNGGSDDNAYTDTIFDDAAAVAITDAATPFSGTFRPEGFLADFNGEDLSGSWTLQVSDDFTLDGGMLLDWGISGQTAMAPPAVPEPGILALFAVGLLGLGVLRRRQS